MKVVRAEFRAAATAARSIPPAVHPEIAVAGRSNVGKSSLLNCMTGRRGLARTSRTPGCTRGLMFFDINDSMTLVDLPGYGYASRSQSERAIWKKLVEHFLSTRQELAGVLILVDVRRGPEDEERELAAYLDAVGLPYAFVATKIDKLKRAALAQQLAAIRRVVAPALVLPTSSDNRTGIDALWRWIRAAIETEPEEMDASAGADGSALENEATDGGDTDGDHEDTA